MNIRPSRGTGAASTTAPSTNLGPFRKSLFLAVGMLVPAPALRGLGTTEEHLTMPIDQRRRDAIAAAIAAYDAAHPKARLPPSAGRLLAVMFPSEDVCQQSLLAIAGEGFDRKRLPATLRRLVEAGFLSCQPGSGVVPDTYRLHLPPVRP